MSPSLLMPCGCCREPVEPAAAIFDGEINAHVCPSCRRELSWAKAQMALVQIKEPYSGADAPDNRIPA